MSAGPDAAGEESVLSTKIARQEIVAQFTDSTRELIKEIYEDDQIPYESARQAIDKIIQFVQKMENDLKQDVNAAKDELKKRANRLLDHVGDQLVSADRLNILMVEKKELMEKEKKEKDNLVELLGEINRGRDNKAPAQGTDEQRRLSSCTAASETRKQAKKRNRVLTHIRKYLPF